MNILVTLNEAYIPCLEVMLRSLVDSTPGQFFSVYLIEASVRDETLDRILYLDPDLIVNRSIAGLYSTDMDGYMFAASSHVRRLMQKVNEKRLDMDDSDPYINSGVMLMNLRKLRAEQNVDDVYDFIEEHRRSLVLPDHFRDTLNKSDFLSHTNIPLCPRRYSAGDSFSVLFQQR